MRSATRSTKPRERSRLVASVTLLPTRLGIVTSRPWMAMRMAVMALRKAAEARMKTRRAIWPSSSRRLRKFREVRGSGASTGSRMLSGGSVIEMSVTSCQAGAQRAAPLRLFARLPWLRSFFLQGRRRVIGELVLAGVGALDFEFIEEQRRADDGGGDAAGTIADQGVVADGDEVAAESADVELAEDSAADELFVAVRIDAIEQARGVGGAERFDAIGVGLALVGNHLDDALLQRFGRLGFRAFQQQHAEVWRRIGAGTGATVTVRGGEVADGLAAEKVAGEGAVVHHGDRLSFHAVVVDIVSADEALTLKFAQRGIVNHAEKVWEDAGLEAGGERADSAVGAAELGLGAENVGADEGGDDVVGGVGSEEHRAAIFLLDDGRLAQGDESVQGFFGVAEERITRGKLFGFGDHPEGIAAETHAVGGLG